MGFTTKTPPGPVHHFMLDHARHPAKRKHQAARVVGRYIAGRDLDGQRRTDNRWSKPGTTALTPTGHASRWAHYSHRKRAGIRMFAAATAVLLLVGSVANWAETVTTLRIAAWILIVAGIWAVTEKSRRYAHRREVVAPLAEVLAQKIGDSRYVLDPRTWIHVPVDVEDHPSKIFLPAAYGPLTETQEKALARVVGKKIGLPHPTFTFEYKGESPYLELRPAPTPRDLVDFTDPAVRELVEKLPEGQLFLGFGPRDQPSLLDLDVQSPHVGMSMATNAGKSTTARGLLAQHLHKGGIALILDPKMDSQLWAVDLPNVRYADTPEEIHAALLWLSGEVDRRNTIVKKHADINGNVDPDLVGPRLMVIAEELNTLEIDLATYWRSIREPGDPIKPVSLNALRRAFNMGRARRVHVVPIAQELLVQCLGGPDAKANLSTRILGRANTPTWNKLAPECKVNGKYPRKHMHRGRVYVVTEEPVLVQTMYSLPEDAREYALSGVVSVFPGKEGVLGQDDHPMNQYGQDVDVPGPRTLDDAEVPAAVVRLRASDEAEAVILSEAAELGIGNSLEALRKAAQRPGFPLPVGSRGVAKTYDLDDLHTWWMTRRQREGDRS